MTRDNQTGTQGRNRSVTDITRVRDLNRDSGTSDAFGKICPTLVVDHPLP
ncbi:unnamed protein product [[Actinomadura] parvosata subsp. kistnae]|nr:unnamed protein product [Actinomadura parvosata subsp. kistnae]